MIVAAAQIAPVLLDRQATLTKAIDATAQAADAGAGLVVFGETLVPAYPLWLSRTGGAAFDDADQKRIHARYLDQAVIIEDGHLDKLCWLARQRRIAVVLGIAERPRERGATLYCSRVVINEDGCVASVHRKLVPTHEERLCWGAGDAHGLRTHDIGPFRLGALNCWENWMPLARAALYADGMTLHAMLWPGCERLTRDITRFAALEGRSFVVSASALIREQDLPDDVPLRERWAQTGEVIYDGGSCIAGPDGRWLLEPQVGREGVFTAELDPDAVLEARQNFDPAGHYARPELLRLTVDRNRYTTAVFQEDQPAGD